MWTFSMITANHPFLLLQGVCKSVAGIEGGGGIKINLPKYDLQSILPSGLILLSKYNHRRQKVI